MLVDIEFSVGERITYYDGKKSHNAVIDKVTLNPLTNSPEYHIIYRKQGSRGAYKTTVSPSSIEESKSF